MSRYFLSLTILFFLTPDLTSMHKSSKVAPTIIFNTIPSQEVIAARLEGMGLENFVKETGIDKQLGGKKMSSLEIFIEVDSAVSTYTSITQNQLFTIPMQLKKAAIIKALLKE